LVESTISPSDPRALVSSSSNMRTSKYSSLITPPRLADCHPGWCHDTRLARWTPYAPEKVRTPNRSLMTESTSTGNGAAPINRNVALASEPRARHLRSVHIVGEEVCHRAQRRGDRGTDAVHFAPEVRDRESTIDGSPTPEEQRSIPYAVVMALKWNSGNGVHTTSSAVRSQQDTDLGRQSGVIVVTEHASLRQPGRAPRCKRTLRGSAG